MQYQSSHEPWTLTQVNSQITTCIFTLSTQNIPCTDLTRSRINFCWFYLISWKIYWGKGFIRRRTANSGRVIKRNSGWREKSQITYKSPRVHGQGREVKETHWGTQEWREVQRTNTNWRKFYWSFIWKTFWSISRFSSDNSSSKKTLHFYTFSSLVLFPYLHKLKTQS